MSDYAGTYATGHSCGARGMDEHGLLLPEVQETVRRAQGRNNQRLLKSHLEPADRYSEEVRDRMCRYQVVTDDNDHLYEGNRIAEADLAARRDPRASSLLEFRPNGTVRTVRDYSDHLVLREYVYCDGV